MAEAPDPVKKGLEELEGEITCPVCQEHFRDPKILPCLHYYCKECVRQVALRAGPNRPFACPECRRETTLPQNDPDQLPTAFFVNRMKELRAKIEKAHDKRETVCEMCSRAKVVAFCRKCAEFICDDCVKSHRNMKVFADHKVVDIQELKEGGAKAIPLKEIPPAMCKDHNEQLKIYCFDCNHLICRDCVMSDHAGHKFEFVNKSTPRYKKIVKESLQPLVKIQTTILASTREVEVVGREISEQHKAVAGTIEQSFKQLHEILHIREKQLLDKASEWKQQKLDNLGVQKKSFELATNEIQGLVEFVECSVESATNEEFMSLQQHIQEQILEQYTKHECINLIPAEVPNIGVRVACAEGISDLCQKNAEVIVLPVDPTKCTAEGPGTEVAKVGESAQFTVHTVYQNSKFCDEKLVVEAELKSIVNDSVVHAKVTSKGRGSYEVTYTPEIRGRHNLIVKVNGTQIAGSPFQVFVKIHPTQLGKAVKVVEVVWPPSGMALNSKQQLVVCVQWGGRIVIVFDRLNGKKLETIIYFPSSLAGHVMNPISVISMDKDDNTYLYHNSSVYKFSKGGSLLKVVGQKGTQPGQFNHPSLVKVVEDKVYVCDRGNHRVQIFNTELEYINSFGCRGDGDSQFNEPNGIAQDRAGNLYVTDTRNNRVQVFDCNGQFLYTFSKKGADSRQLDRPHGIFIGSDQFVYVCERGNKCVSVFKTSGEFVTSFGRFISPSALLIDDDGFVYVGEFRLFGFQSTVIYFM